MACHIEKGVRNYNCYGKKEIDLDPKSCYFLQKGVKYMKIEKQVLFNSQDNV